VSDRLSRWLGGPWADAVAVAWGFAEATLFFIVPDVLLTLSAGVTPRRSVRHLGLAIAGAVAGGLVMFCWSAQDAARARRAVESVPYVRPWMFERVEGNLSQSGAWGVCRGPLSGIPYKVYAVEAPRHAGALAFAAVSIPARAERLGLTWAQFLAAGWAARRWSGRPVRWVVGVHAAYWVAVYAWYWSTV
jgi:hypothetical protein